MDNIPSVPEGMSDDERDDYAAGARAGRKGFHDGEAPPGPKDVTPFNAGFRRGWLLEQRDEKLRSTPGVYRQG